MQRLIREICEFIKDAYDKHMSTQEIDALVKEKLKVRAEEEAPLIDFDWRRLARGYLTALHSSHKNLQSAQWA